MQGTSLVWRNADRARRLRRILLATAALTLAACGSPVSTQPPAPLSDPITGERPPETVAEPTPAPSEPAFAAVPTPPRPSAVTVVLPAPAPDRPHFSSVAAPPAVRDLSYRTVASWSFDGRLPDGWQAGDGITAGPATGTGGQITAMTVQASGPPPAGEPAADGLSIHVPAETVTDLEGQSIQVTVALAGTPGARPGRVLGEIWVPEDGKAAERLPWRPLTPDASGGSAVLRWTLPLDLSEGLVIALWPDSAMTIRQVTLDVGNMEGADDDSAAGSQ